MNMFKGDLSATRYLWSMVWTIFVLVVLAITPASAQGKKPNVLVIWGDDIGVHNSSAYNKGVMGYQAQSGRAL